MLFRKIIKTTVLTLFTFNIFYTSTQALAEVRSKNDEVVNVIPSRAELQQKLINALVGEYSNFLALTEHPTTVGDFPPIIQRAEVVVLANGEEGLLVHQGLLSSRSTGLASTHYRRTLYLFTSTPHSDALIQVSYPLTPNFTKELLSEPGALSQLERLPGCEIHWQYEQVEDSQLSFNGYRSPSRCFFIDEHGVAIHLETILHVGNNELQMTENLLDGAGEPLSEADLVGTLSLTPIRFFEMTVSFLPDGSNADDDEAWLSVQPEGLIHDHGQRINLLTKNEQQALPYEIKLVRGAQDENQLQVRIYSLGSETPMQDLAVELTEGVGVLNAEPLRVEIQIRR